MKRYVLAFGLLGIMPVLAANGVEYQNTTNKYTTSRPAKTSSYKNTSSVKKSGGYRNTITNNFYYTQPDATDTTSVRSGARSSSYTPTSGYKGSYTNKNSNYDTNKSNYRRQDTYSKTSYSSQERKYFLAHPFFQPLKGRFGSVTDVSYATSNLKFNILNADIKNIAEGTTGYGDVFSGPANLTGKATMTQLLVKEDISFGITDTLAVIAMAQYDSTKTKFKDWSTGDPENSMSGSGLNVFGIGVQNRFVDNTNWIGMVSAFYQHQKDTANTFAADLKMGYKIDRTTLYGLVRGGYSSLTKGDAYGAVVKDSTGDWMMLSYKYDVDDILYLEGGVGAFAVLNKYVTLNGELYFGNYDWHDQLNIKGAIGFQPGDMFALNLYAAATVYDSAKDKTKKYMNYNVNPELEGGAATAFPDTTLVYTTGDYKIKNYNEWKIGVQAVFYF